MAKANATTKKQNKINLGNLSERDVEILTLETKDVMKKYKIEKQAVYDRRFALNKKIKAAGLSVEKLLNNDVKPEQAPKKTPKKVQPRKERAKTTETEKAEAPVEDKESSSREVMVVNKQIPVIMKPIEINFENFSIRLNGVPKKISVNPDTNAIEIDL
jgi:hypothetical protein